MARSRYRRAGRASPSKAATVFLLIVLIGVIVWFAAVGNLGAFIRDRIIAPLTAASATGGETKPAASATASATSMSGATGAASTGAEASRITGTVYMRGFSVYCVQWGAFSSQANAECAAAGFESRGAAAYVMEDGTLFRVLGDGFLSRNEAVAARDVYIAFYKTDACLYELLIPTVSLKVVATQEQLDAMQRAFDTWLSTMESIRSMIDGYGAREITADTCVLRLDEYARDLTQAADELSAVAGDTSQSPVLQGLLSVLEKGGTDLSALSSRKNSETEAVFLSDMKHHYIGLLDDFVRFAGEAELS
jgi:hypothetical protein